MNRVKSFFYCICLLCFLPVMARAQNIELKNAAVAATFGPRGLQAVQDEGSGRVIRLTSDEWSIGIDQDTLRSNGEAHPQRVRNSSEEVTYTYQISGYQVEVVYQLHSNWHFVSKQLKVVKAPRAEFTVHRLTPLDDSFDENIQSAFVPTTYLAQFGLSPQASRHVAPAHDFGAFLRMGQDEGLMLLVQNPFLDASHKDRSANLGYSPELFWKQDWGTFTSDIACIGPYHLSGEKIPAAMVPEWKLAKESVPVEGMDRAEIAAFTNCVRAFLIDPSPTPTSVEVGWTLNDYQIDAGTPEGVAEYKRIIDVTSELGIKTLLYAPANSKLSNIDNDADTWHWEHVLWLGLGQKIRKNEWNPQSSPVPTDVAAMIAYAKKKNVGLLAYVYPSIPYEQNASWIVPPRDPREHVKYATLASRELQDFLIKDLIAFKRRTGIAGYSFDYTWLNLPGSSSYAQWWGWRRVMEALRRAEPSIVIDGRQSYQNYGPWSWLAGSYPHPTGNDEQPESFLPYPDLHFDRVSADRARYVNYWYRNYQFAPSEVVPGYATHQTERSVNIPPDKETSGHPQEVKTLYTAYRRRDWDYLGFRYSFLSSIATAGWNNVVNMIPARDMEEYKHFSAADKAWIRDWIEWTTAHKEYLRNTRTILDQPAVGNVDGTAAFVGDHGYLFLFNPNYKQLPAVLHLDNTIGLAASGNPSLLIREVYPRKGVLIGKPGAGFWKPGDTLHLDLDGTSATVLEVVAAPSMKTPLVFNASGDHLAANLQGTHLQLVKVDGEPGTDAEVGVVLPSNIRITALTVNGAPMKFKQNENYVSASIHFDGTRFAQAQQIKLDSQSDGTLSGTFTIPRRVFDQLQARKKAWPIPWSTEDLETTWLAPERLLLYIQIAEAKDSASVSATLDGKELRFERAYTSVRVHPADFVGFYADVSTTQPDVQHTLTLKLSGVEAGKLQGVFFDNVEPQFTEKIVSSK